MHDDIKVGDKVALVSVGNFMEIFPGDIGAVVAVMENSVLVHFDKWNAGVQPNDMAMTRVETRGKPCNMLPKNYLIKASPTCMFNQGGT